MLIETKRLIIRDVKSEDEKAFVEMASDGSLYDIGFDDGCSYRKSRFFINREKDV